MKEAETSFLKVFSLDSRGKPSMHAYRMLAHMRQGQGQHAAAVKILTKALSFNSEDQRAEAVFLRGACNQAIGAFRVRGERTMANRGAVVVSCTI